jgi:hypothetical protein
VVLTWNNRVGLEWLHQARNLVEKYSPASSVLVSEQLWDRCLEDDACTIPTKQQLKSKLKWLKKNKFIGTSPSGVKL